MQKQFELIELNPEDMLVSNLPDYFKKNQKSFDTTIKDHQMFDVGIVEHVGEKLNKDIIGKVIYFHSNLSETINLKGIGVFEKVGDSLKILIRKDQDRNNY